MTPQQEIDTLRVMLGKALGAMHNVPCWDWDDANSEGWEAVVREIEALGIEEIGLPERWRSPAEIAAHEKWQREQDERTRIEREQHPERFVSVTREDILNDDLGAIPAAVARVADLYSDAAYEALERKRIR